MNSPFSCAVGIAPFTKREKKKLWAVYQLVLEKKVYAQISERQKAVHISGVTLEQRSFLNISLVIIQENGNFFSHYYSSENRRLERMLPLSKISKRLHNYYFK